MVLVITAFDYWIVHYVNPNKSVIITYIFGNFTGMLVFMYSMKCKKDYRCLLLL